MKITPFIGLTLAAAVLVAGGAAPAASTTTDGVPSLASHLSDKWLEASELTLNTEHGVIFYHGSAHRVSAVTEPWRGTVKGDILYLSAHQAVLVPSGTLTVGPKDALKITGPHRTFLAKAGEHPAWEKVMGD